MLATRMSAEQAAELLLAVSRRRDYNAVGRTFRIASRLRTGREPRRPRDDRHGRHERFAGGRRGPRDGPVDRGGGELRAGRGRGRPASPGGNLHLLTDADAVVVVAGMEGALPSVVGGHVSCPVIAVPTSVGYGAAFGGLAALLGHAQ